MSRVLLVATHLLIPTALSQSDVCVSGLTGSLAELNGLYTSAGAIDSKPYYERIAPSPCNMYYLYWSNSYNYWLIDEDLDDYYIHGYCGSSSLSNCANSWFIYDFTYSDFVLDSSVDSSFGSCPTHIWQCDAVQIPSLSNGCDKLFDVHLGDNLWTNSAQTWYWYWNEYYFSWICDNEHPDSGQCTDSYYAVALRTWPWVEIPSGESRSLSFKWPDNNAHTVYCIMDPTPFPSNTPTSQPTANPSEVTLLPTRSPFAVPSSIPTANPQPQTSMLIVESRGDVPPIGPSDTPDADLSLGATAGIVGVVLLMAIFVAWSVYASHNKNKLEKELLGVLGAKAKGDDGNLANSNGNPVPKPDHEEEKMNDQSVNDVEEVKMNDLDPPPGSGAVTGGHLNACDDATPLAVERRMHKDALDLQYWLHDVVGLPQYFDLFMNSGYEGTDFIKEIQEIEELIEVGIESEQHRNQIFKEIVRLNGEEMNMIAEENKLKANVLVDVSISVPLPVEEHKSDDNDMNGMDDEKDDIEELYNEGKTTATNTVIQEGEGVQSTGISHEVTVDTYGPPATTGCIDQHALFKQWLTQKVRLPQYHDLLVQNGFATLELIIEITDEDLKMIGISKIGHARKFLKEIQRLKEFKEYVRQLNEDDTETLNNTKT
eukprot:1129297_1